MINHEEHFYNCNIYLIEPGKQVIFAKLQKKMCGGGGGGGVVRLEVMRRCATAVFHPFAWVSGIIFFFCVRLPCFIVNKLKVFFQYSFYS